MPDVVPVGEFVTDEWYPGFTPGFEHSPWVVEPFRPFRSEDESRFWFLDFHWPRGLSPMGLVWCEDGYAWGTQLACESLPLPPGKGIVPRLAGTHVYAGAIDVDSEWELEQRATRAARNLPPILDRFPDIWAARVEELTAGLAHFEGVDLSRRSLAELGAHLRDARTFFRRSFEVHFELMYPLLANYVAFHGLCQELGIDPGQIAKFCQGYDNKILETDRELWKLTADARRLGLDALFVATEPEKLLGTLSAAGGNAAAWLTHFHEFLQVYGWRTEGICDIILPSWIEDPTSALGTIRTFLQRPQDFDFDAARGAAEAERETAIDAARSSLTRGEQAAFDQALAAVHHANFAWWNDEHNFLIDLRSMLPMRHACLAIGQAVEADRPDDTVFLFWEELMAVCSGSRRWSAYRGLVAERRDYYRNWQDRRPTMPKVLGTIPDAVQDPVLIEVFGMHHHFFEAIRAGGEVSELVGVAASTGTARGPARVLLNADELHRLQPGDILVCESTSPNWTPAFGKVAGCVCDNGGTLCHASIVSREYRIPCVVGVGLATSIINTGDEVEVDGTKGVVRIFR
ncbi:MAG: PEP-utilizing enzyme [Acidimicrobiia bacterium]